MKKKQNISGAFTLVELIVVITILAILGTIAFISLQGYSAQARDSVRKSDISNIKLSLELFTLNTGKYPIPSSGLNLTYSGGVVWNQGTIGKSVVTNIGKISKIPTDPLTENEYSYSKAQEMNEYMLSVGLEEELSYNESFITQTNAANKILLAYTDGNFNGAFSKVRLGGILKILATPSLMVSNITSGTELKNTNLGNSLIIKGEKNLIGSSTGQITYTFPNDDSKIIADFTPTNLTEIMAMADKLILVYSGTLLKDKIGVIQNILTKQNEGESKQLAANFINNYLKTKITIDNAIIPIGSKVIMQSCPTGWNNVGDVLSLFPILCNGVACNICEATGVDLKAGDKVIMQSCPTGWNNVGDVISRYPPECNGVACNICEAN